MEGPILRSVVFNFLCHTLLLYFSGELYIMLLGVTDDGVPVPGIHEPKARKPKRPALDRARRWVVPHLLLLRQVSTTDVYPRGYSHISPATGITFRYFGLCRLLV